jgi:ArsR family transcriptional regulator
MPERKLIGPFHPRFGPRPARRFAAALKLLAQPQRLLIVAALLAEGTECQAGLVERMTVGQPTVAHHLRLLCDAGLVERKKVGAQVWYRLDRAAYARLAAALTELDTPGGGR